MKSHKWCKNPVKTLVLFVYRLISEKTVEENILKKAQNKRILGNIAIEGGNFTAAYFKQGSLKDLFETNVDAEETPSEATDAESNKVEEVVEEVASGEQPLKDTEYEEVSLNQTLGL